MIYFACDTSQVVFPRESKDSFHVLPFEKQQLTGEQLSQALSLRFYNVQMYINSTQHRTQSLRLPEMVQELSVHLRLFQVAALKKNKKKQQLQTNGDINK